MIQIYNVCLSVYLPTYTMIITILLDPELFEDRIRF